MKLTLSKQWKISATYTNLKIKFCMQIWWGTEAEIVAKDVKIFLQIHHSFMIKKKKTQRN